MALNIQAPKNRLLLPFFILLVILLAPFALLFSLVRLPFAKDRVAALNKVIAEDWIPRSKFIYLNYDEGFPLAKFVERELIPKYGSYIIFDRWSDDDSEWTESEPGTHDRVVSIQQDIAGDFDGEPHLLVAILTPQDSELTKTMKNILYFTEGKGGHVVLGGKDITREVASKQVLHKIRSSLDEWEKE
jgi:hypothetical protein